ncbi:MAG: pilus assembly protein, partial [Rhodospirillales bacterium]|nr:pilus assembly protein [Rhodospirillales bacterium]
MQRLLHRLRGNAQGAAAVEFAMIAPLMFTLFVGSVEFSQAI